MATMTWTSLFCLVSSQSWDTGCLKIGLSLPAGEVSSGARAASLYDKATSLYNKAASLYDREFLLWDYAFDG